MVALEKALLQSFKYHWDFIAESLPFFSAPPPR
jgi:hypothetical protein